MAIRNVIALQDTYVDSRIRREGEKFTVDDTKVPIDGQVIGADGPEPEPAPAPGTKRSGIEPAPADATEPPLPEPQGKKGK